MSNASVSIIVPIYNVAPFVAQCLHSLVRQSLGNLEIIIVDDGSTDQSSDIINSFDFGKKTVKIISQENCGLSAARNTGMGVAKGEYIGFVDGDDWIDENMFETLYSMAISSQADIVICNGQLIDHATGESKPIQDQHVWATLKSRHDTLILSPKTEPDLFMLDTSVCKRLFRREFLESLRFQFPPGKIFEDIPTHFHLLLNTKTVVLVDRKFYFYRTNRPKRITARTDKTLLQVFDVMKQVVDELHLHDADQTIWANFIWFQAWVLKWLRNQIDSQYLEEYIEKTIVLAKHFKEGSVRGYLEKFTGDRQSRIFVLEQTNHAGFRQEHLKFQQTSDQLKNSLNRTNQLQQQLDTLYKSKSWKLTAPLRWISDLLRIDNHSSRS